VALCQMQMAKPNPEAEKHKNAEFVSFDIHPSF
jgi:hypothetical protein